MSKEKPNQEHNLSLGVDKQKKKGLSKTRWFLLTIILIFACGGSIWYGRQIVNSINTSFDQNNQKTEDRMHCFFTLSSRDAF